MIAEISARERVIFATGGGAILAAENRTHLAGRGTVIYLHTSVAQQLRRTRGDKRPLLNQGRRKGVLTELMAAREPLYREVADLVVMTDGRSVAGVAAEIREKLAGEG